MESATKKTITFVATRTTFKKYRLKAVFICSSEFQLLTLSKEKRLKR